jgi:DNA primase small subunit
VDRGAKGTAQENMSYYGTQFPADEVFKFCTLHHSHRPENREIAVTNAAGFWTRYNSVLNPKELRTLLLKRGPAATLHLGPHYHGAADRARGREIKGKQLPFDLDLTDVPFLGGFDGISRTDQTSNDRFVRLVFGQAHVLRAILHEVFGFEHFLPVYSGRRGVHLWVLDERADALTDEARKAICAMINPPKSREDGRIYNREAILGHPSFSGPDVSAAVGDVVKRVLLAPIKEGGIGLFRSKYDVQTFLDTLLSQPEGKAQSKYHELETECREEIKREFQNVHCAVDTYQLLESFLEKNAAPPPGRLNASAKNIVYKQLLNKLRDVMFTLVWPTIDAGPTGQRQHCVKIPFSEHGETGRISLPVDRLLPVSGGHPLPPIITSRDLNTPGPLLDRFLLAVAHMRSSLAFAYRDSTSPETMDIEDLVPGESLQRSSKRPMFE